jgi:hypothetical protein
MSGLVELEGDFAAYCTTSLAFVPFSIRGISVNLPVHDRATESIYSTFLHFTIDPDILKKPGDEVGDLVHSIQRAAEGYFWVENLR